MDDLMIRDAVADDLGTIQDFLKPFVDDEALLPRSTDELSLLLQHGFIASIRDQDTNEIEVVGFSALEIYSKKLAEIQCLAVSPNFQGLGIGRRLVHSCVERAKRESVLELMAISASDKFLQNCGFDYSLPNQKRALFFRPGS